VTFTGKFVITLLSIALFFNLTGHSTSSATENSVVVSTTSIIDSLDTSEIMKHIENLSTEIGVRVAGSENESHAADYIARELERYGYLARFSTPFTLHNDLSSVNVWAELPGVRDDIMIIGAHYDSKHPSPGANDNASGAALVLELAHVLSKTKPPHTIHFVFFGAEEVIDRNPDHHHYGSRFLAENPTPDAAIHSMTSVDMVAVGSALWIDSMNVGPTSWRTFLINKAENLDLNPQSGETRAWSDHEAFEHAGVPVAWVHWRYDNEYHKSTDTPDRLDIDLMHKTANLMLSAILECEGDSTVQVNDLNELIAF